MYGPVTSQVAVLAINQVVSMATDTTSVSWVQTGILGAVVLAIVWGFKTEFLALGRELRREREVNATLVEQLKDKDAIIDRYRTVMFEISKQVAGSTMPILGQAAMQAVESRRTLEDVMPRADQLEEVRRLLEDLRQEITHGSPTDTDGR
jgi:hypothetical protein